MPPLRRNKTAGPMGGAGLVRYYDVEEGGPKMDPKFIIGLVIGVIILLLLSNVLL